MTTPADRSHILLVEDSAVALDQLHLRLESDFHYEILTARTYAEAKELIRSHRDDIFVAVVDLSLPDASGGEIVDLTEENGISSIVLTSTVSPSTRKQILAKRVIDYVVKSGRALDEVSSLIGRLLRNADVSILLVDDSRSVRAYVRALLELYMFQVQEADSGKAALKLLGQEHAIRLVITDYEMGDMNGLELTAAIREDFARDDLAIIGISSRSDKALSVQFLKLGANDYLDKPFEKEEFFCRVLKNIETVEDRQRLKELDELRNRFLGMVVHDLRNPINAIKGFASLMENDSCKSSLEEFSEMAGFINRAASQMNDLVSDLLDIAVIESGKLELEVAPHAVHEIIEERVNMQRIPAQRKRIVVDQSLQQVVATVDHERLAQVADNLLSNALKFSAPDTHVRVSLEQQQGNLVLKVSDQGQGIPQAEQSKLFDSFQKLSVRPTAGENSTGLGLTIVKKIVEAHHGSVSVESREGKGACFSVCLPLDR